MGPPLTVRRDPAVDLYFFCGSTSLDTQSYRRERYDHAFDERVPRTTERLDAAVHNKAPDRLADLNSDGTVGMRDNAIELCVMHSARIHVESTRTLAESFDWCQSFELVHYAEVGVPANVQPKRWVHKRGSPCGGLLQR